MRLRSGSISTRKPHLRCRLSAATIETTHPRFSWFLHWKLPEPRLKFLDEANQGKNLVRSYLASISFVDSQVGRVLEALEANGHKDDTVVVLWSDHGWHSWRKTNHWQEFTLGPFRPGATDFCGAWSRPKVRLLTDPLSYSISIPPWSSLPGFRRKLVWRV